MKTLSEQLDGLEGFTEIEIRGYESTSGEVSNVKLDVATTYGQAKDMDHDLLLEYKDIEEVKELQEASEGNKTSYDDLWVNAYDALAKSFQPKTAPTLVPAKVVVPNKRLCKGCGLDEVKDKCYIKGFITERTTVSKSLTTKKARKKQILTVFKDHMRDKFVTTTFATYSPVKGKVSLEGKTLVIDCNED